MKYSVFWKVQDDRSTGKFVADVNKAPRPTDVWGTENTVECVLKLRDEWRRVVRLMLRPL
jgi:hypothetical protein